MRVYVGSLGCKLNQSEMDRLAGRLSSEGHEIVTSPEKAELCILNTCAVTHVAAQKTRQALRRLHRANPNARLVATGCYAELHPGEVRELPGIYLVTGNQAKAHLPALIGQGDVSNLPPPIADFPSPISGPRTRAFVKIQDGCDNACTYCIVHVARGPQRSRPAGEILAEVEARLAAGYQEIVLTGVHIGAYGRDRGQSVSSGDLWDLVARILSETTVPRLRLSSIEPWDLPAGALALWEDSRLCKHLHLPLQSGSNAVLERMGRRYTTDRFASLVKAARIAIPDLAVTSDVIVGFPGETECEANESRAFVQSMAFARVHVFPYSSRQGTPAAGMPDQVPASDKARRAKAMRVLSAASAREFRQQFVGRVMDVLWESSRKEGLEMTWSGLTDNYLRVHTVHAGDLRNHLTATQMVSVTKDGLRGQIGI
jgi:threonylcarbamoyladenosine tRNA methylthiotransferase MtaB